MRNAGQLVLDLGHEVSRSRDDFVAASANEAGLRSIERWPDWPARGFALIGPEGSGKSHLAAIWRERTGARAIRSPEDGTALAPGGALVLEDAEETARAHGTALFHLMNLANERGGWLLLTARRPPRLWDVPLPDLASRLVALPSATLSSPDDALLAAVIAKQLADRQLTVEPDVVAYLLQRMERSLGAARRLVAELDAASLAQGRRITKAMARRIVEADDPADAARDPSAS